MSESEVSLIRDEDLLRRMWQQTEDFGRKKEIRAHMYKLREERLRELYSPEPRHGKGSEGSPAQHGRSFADQTFQSMKSKEVRDASSPSKEFSYRGQDLKELSNAGWNVESEDRTTDGGQTQVKVVNANIEGRYEVEGGQGRFAAVDKQRRAVTERHDATSSVCRDEAASDTAAHEHVERTAHDGTRISSTTSSSNTSSEVRQVSATTRPLPFEQYDKSMHDTNRNDRGTTTIDNDRYEQSLRTNDFSTVKQNANTSTSELVSRKVEYPDSNTKVIVETRLMPDGTRVTSTRREFRAPAHTSTSEYHSSQSESYSSQHKSDYRDSTNTRHASENRANDIVDSQRNSDDYDFKRQLREYTSNDHDNSQSTDKFSQKRYETKVNSKLIDQHSSTSRSDQTHQYKAVDIDRSTTNKDDHIQTQRHIVDRQTDDTDLHQTTTTRDHNIQHKILLETRHIDDLKVNNISNIGNEEKNHHVSTDRSILDYGGRQISTDKTVPANRVHKAPSEHIPTSEKICENLRETAIPEKENYNVSQNETAPEIFRDVPRYGTIPDDRSHNISKDRTITNEKIHHNKKESKVEEVEKNISNDHYQTTYQNDFQSRKVSTDWSPTHQAWASTLRSDTPSTTHPSTRASSPGSRTFKSSTSSLRSSVSPDKSYRKPSSRGSSPSKVGHHSPTRTVTSSRYSCTHSTQSVTEERPSKNTSPERKPPTGRSSGSPAYSPDRKPKDSYRQRPSVSPEKQPKISSDRPNISPDRKPTDVRSKTASPLSKKEDTKSPITVRQSPERRPAYQPTDKSLSHTYPRTSPNRTSPDRKDFDQPDCSLSRSSLSPDRKPTGIRVASSPPQLCYPSDNSLQKPGISPERKPGFQHTTDSNQHYDSSGEKYTQDYSTKRPSTSPERKPGYMRPTASSQPDKQTKIPSRPEKEPECKSPGKQVSMLMSDRKPDEFKQNTKIKEDHYHFVDEETKVYTNTDRTKVDNKVVSTSTIEEYESRPRNKSPSLLSQEPGVDSDYCNVPKSRESPFNKDKSPIKHSVINTENDKLYGKVDKTANITKKNDKQTDENTTKRNTQNKKAPAEKANIRETSPSKYGTYDKKKTREEVYSTITSEDAKDVQYDSTTGRDKTPPKKVTGVPSSPVKSPRDSASPVKSPIRETRYQHMTDFITTEKTTEEVNKRTTTKDHPRQLVTPSSSPTRKPKTIETELSTGQSSPTTSVSGFVYFESPRTERSVVTDLDEFCPDSYTLEETTKRPESLEIKKSPSPSKIPCRSPSPEKNVTTAKENLPRKSSLKKPSTEFNLTSPVEKPPTSFRISPTDDKPDVFDHKVVKKDQPSEPETGEPKLTNKSKPPLQRRETYDDRCKKILGLVEDTSKTETRETRKYTKQPDSTQNSPSVSPCNSPVLDESSAFSDYHSTKKTTKVNVTDFITHEREDLIRTTKTLSTDNSPTKVQDIRKTTLVTGNTINDEVENKATKTVTPYPSSRHSPEIVTPKDLTQKHSHESAEIKRAPSPPKSTENLPTNLNKSPKQYTQDTLPTRSTTERNYNKTTTLASTFETSSNLDDVHEITKTSKPTRVLESPTRSSPTATKQTSEQTGQPRSTSPLKHQPKDGSSVRKTQLPGKNNTSDILSYQLEPKQVDSHDPRPRDSPEKIPGYMKPTTAIASKTESHHNVKNVAETHSTRKQEKIELKSKTPSPTRQTLRSQSPTKCVSPSDGSQIRPDTSPQQKPAKVPYKNTDVQQIQSTKIVTTKIDKTKTSEDTQETIVSSTTALENERISSGTVSPTRKSIQSKSVPERSLSPAKSNRPSEILTDKTPVEFQREKESFMKKPASERPSKSPPTIQKVPGYMKTTESMTLKHEYDTSEYKVTATEEEKFTSKVTDNIHSRISESPSRSTSKTDDRSSPENIRAHSPSKPIYKEERKRHDVPDGKSGYVSTSRTEKRVHPKEQSQSPTRTNSSIKDNSCSENKYPKHTPEKSTATPDRSNFMKLADSITSKFDTTTTASHEIEETCITKAGEPTTPYSTNSPAFGRQSMEREPNDTPGYLSKPEASRQLRTPSPAKKTTTITGTNNDFIKSEREQEILNRVQQSLRKLSPEREEKSPSKERSPSKTTTSLQDLDIITSKATENKLLTTENLTKITEDQTSMTSKVPRPTQLNEDQAKDQKTPSKPTSRNVSPIKRAPMTTVSNKLNKTPESPTKARSFSPKKPISHMDRPQSPQQPKISGIKPREQIPPHLTRKPTPATLSTTKIERLASDTKKTNIVTKQNVFTKCSSMKTTNKSIPSQMTKVNELDVKRTSSHIKNSVIRTASDIAMKPKKTTSPQRIKSKPEIQISDMCMSTKSQKPHTKLPTKPKSATSLNTSMDEDDILIDVQQSKSSRENSPDRICPTPINFADDVGIPRFPDVVSEPDDNFTKRAHQTIHETESVVDDIVEICEDEELFIKKSGMDVITKHDDSLLSVNDKVIKFTNKSGPVPILKNIATTFKDTEKNVHSDFLDINLKSDECLLTVSEKVNKFAKGPKDTKDHCNSSRKITDEYDKDTVYTDDYTKLSVNDKAHLFIETAENIKTNKIKQTPKIERPDLSQVDESLKSDDCLLSVSDKVNKFVRTAEQYLTETQEDEEKELKIKQLHEKPMREIVDSDHDEQNAFGGKKILSSLNKEHTNYPVDSSKIHPNEPKLSQSKTKNYSSPNKPVDRVPPVKITTLRSSEAVKKAKALFENIASTQPTKQNEQKIQSTKTTKLTDIGVIKKSPKSDSTTVLHPSVENMFPQVTDVDSEVDFVSQIECPSNGPLTKPQQHCYVDDKPNRLSTQSPEVPRSKSPMRQNVEVTTTKTVLSRYPAATRAESPRHRPESPKPRTESPRQRTESSRQRPDSDKLDKVPGYLRPTKTSQIKEETKVEEVEVSSRRGSGKFGVELRRTSIERSTVSSERRRSVEHHQPCIEDIFDLDLLEQMLEKVTGYEQRRRIRAQIRIAKNQGENFVETHTHLKTTKITNASKSRSPDRKVTKSPESMPKSPQRITSPERHSKPTSQNTVSDHPQFKEPIVNGHSQESSNNTTIRQRPHSPEKPAPKSNQAHLRQLNPDKRRTTSPNKVAPKSKGNRFNEYATAYMKKVGLNESEKIKITDNKKKKTTDSKQTLKHESQERTVQEFTSTKILTEQRSSKDVFEVIQSNGNRSPSPELRQSPERKVKFPNHKAHIPDHKTQSPERRAYSPERKPQSYENKAESPDCKVYSPERKESFERLHQRTPSPDFKRPKTDSAKDTIIKTVYDIEKKIPSKPVQEEKPSWVTNRTLRKVTSDTRTVSTKKIDNEKPKYRAPSPSKVIAKPIDVITSSYGPGPLDADGKPLFGIKALRNGGSNFQVKGTVVRQEFHSRNGGAPEGSVSVTAYSSEPQELERLLAAQGQEAPSRIHGLSAITTTKKFGGDTGNTLANVHTKEDRASLEQFTHHERRVEHLERSYDRTHQLPGDTSVEEVTIEDITTNSGRTQLNRDRQNRSDRSRREEVTEGKRQDRTDKRKEENFTEVKRQRIEDRREKMERREDKKTVRQSSVKSLTEKFIKSANDSGKSDRSAYPKAGLILRTTALRDSVSSDDTQPAGLTRTDSEHSVCSAGDTVTTTHTRSTITHHQPVITTKKTIISEEPVMTTRKTTVVTREPAVTTKRTTVVTQEPVTHRVTHGRQGVTVTTERSFLDSSTKVTGVQDILTRMKNADIVIREGDTSEDSEARALLNKFLGATVLMAGMQGYVHERPGPDGSRLLHQETVVGGGGEQVGRTEHELDLDHCWDERLLKKLLSECTEYEQRRRLRARLRTLMAEQEACASAVTEALGASETEHGGAAESETREEEEVNVTSSVRRDSSDKTVSSSTTTTTSKVIEMTRPAPKPVSPFAKFRQLEKQNSINSPNSPKTPQSPGSPSQPYFKFTDPALQSSALTIKERLLQWCRDKTRDYENVKLENFSTSWADGLAFCALVHHFLPTAFDYSKLTPDRRRHNFTLAFKVADEKAGIYPLLDVDDMVAMRKPDWKCVFTYVQAIYRRFKDEP